MSVTLDVDDEPTPGLTEHGKPDPAYAVRLGLQPASAGRRAAAFAVDASIWILLSVPTIIGFIALIGPLTAVQADVVALDVARVAGPLIGLIVGQSLTAVFGLVQLILHGRRGITVGKAALRLRSVSVRDFGPAGFWRIVLRALVLFGSEIVLPVVGPILCFISFLWDPERRGRSWLDRIGGCFVIDTRAGIDSFDGKAMRHARRAIDALPLEIAQVLPSLASARVLGEEFVVPLSRSRSGVVSAGTGLDQFDGFITPPQSDAPAYTSRALITAAPLSAPSAQPGFAPEPDQAPAVSYVMHFDNGARVVASAHGRIGRAPFIDVAESHTQLIPVADYSMQISKTHADFGVAPTGFWVSDLSTNGTEIVHPDGRTATLAPGTRTTIPVGARVMLGGRSFTLETDTGDTPA